MCVCVCVWEPPTKQFYPKCQSPRVLPSRQSAWSIAAPRCIGSRPASRQSIRDGHPERSWARKGCPTPRYTDWLTVSRKVTLTLTDWPSQWIQCNERVRTYIRTCIEKLRALASWLRERSRRVTATTARSPPGRDGPRSAFRPVHRRSWFCPYQLPAAALSRSTTNIRCGVRDPTYICAAGCKKICIHWYLVNNI
jgi:hypothetical protein